MCACVLSLATLVVVVFLFISIRTRSHSELFLPEGRLHIRQSLNLPPISFSWDHTALPEVLPFFHFFSAPSFLLITLGDREAPCKVNFL